MYRLAQQTALGKRTVRLLAICTLFFLCQNPLPAQNLITNGGFETATQGIPSGTPIPGYPTTLNSWTATNTDGEFILDPTRAHSGNGFLSVLQNNGASPGTYWLGAAFSFAGYDRAGQVVSVAPNTVYTLSFWYRGGDGSRYGYGPGNLKVHVEEMASTNTGIANLTIPATGSWQFFTTSISTGPTASQVIVLFSPQGPSNIDVWIDDVEFGLGSPLVEELPGILEETEEVMDLFLYPNPAQSEVHVQIPAEFDWKGHHLFDMSGRLLDIPFTQTDTELQFQTETLESGLYLLKVQGRNSTETLKFTIQ